jgi:hypothetical protein
MNYNFSYCSKKVSPWAACASIINTEMIALLQPFYHQKMLISASEKQNFTARDTAKVMHRKGNGKVFMPLR